MFRTFLLLIFAFVLGFPAAADAESRFVSVAFHDIVDFRGDLDDDAVTVDRLIAFFEWLKAHHWTPISLDEISAANRGEKSLPKNSILITFDDGYRSLYSRVFPLALAYRIPIVSGLVGSWLDAPMDASVLYGDRMVPRSNFLTWPQIQEMDRSGLVEFASHTFALHAGVLANPQGNQLPAAANRIYNRQHGYESQTEFCTRLATDFQQSRDLMEKYLGKAPRALIWPFGRYNQNGVEAAKAAGFQFALTLDPEPADAREPMALSRYLPTHDPDLATALSSLRFEDPLPNARRIVALDPASLWTGNPQSSNERLGKTIDRLLALGATTLILEAGSYSSNGNLESVWFPNSQIPLQADFLSRIAWQCQSRAKVTVYVRLPTSAALSRLGSPEKVLRLAHELAIQVPLSGLCFDDVPQLAALSSPNDYSGTPWAVRQARQTQTGEAPSLALRAFRIAETERPGLRLALMAAPGQAHGPSRIADLTLLPLPTSERPATKLINALGALHLNQGNLRRLGLWFTDRQPPAADALIALSRKFQRSGGTVIGWANDDSQADRPAAKIVAPTISAAKFPVKF